AGAPPHARRPIRLSQAPSCHPGPADPCPSVKPALACCHGHSPLTSDATTRDEGEGAAACWRPAPSCPGCCGGWETFVYTLKDGPAGGPPPGARSTRVAPH